MAEKTEKKSFLLRLIAGSVLALVLLVALGIAVWFRLNPSDPSDLLPSDDWFSKIYTYRAEQVENVQIEDMIKDMAFPGEMKFTGDIESTNDDRGRRLRIYFKCSDTSSEIVDAPDNKGLLDICGMTFFSLIGDLDRVSFVVSGGGEETVLPYSREWAEYSTDEAVFDGAADPERFKAYCQFILALHQAALEDMAH